MMNIPCTLGVLRSIGTSANGQLTYTPSTILWGKGALVEHLPYFLVVAGLAGPRFFSNS